MPLFVLSVLEAAILGGLAALTNRVTSRWPRLQAESVFAWLCAAITSPYLLWVSSQLFSGPRAQRLPGARFLGIAAFFLALFCVRATVSLVRGLRGRPLTGAALGLVFTLGFYGADRWVLPRLYPWFHLTLELLFAIAAQATVFFFSAGLKLPQEPRRQSPRHRLIWSLLYLLSLVLAGHGLLRLHRATVLRGLVLTHTTIGAAIMRPYAAFRARGSASSSIKKSDVGASPWGEPVPPPYTGPRLGGRDVFLITVDALRQDRLRPEIMPATSALAKRGIVFTRAYTQVPHTSFAIATLLTGKPIYALTALGQEVSSHETLPLLLRRFRYKTAAFYPPAVFYIEHERLKRLEESAYGFEYVKYEYLNAPRRTDQVMAFLEAEHPPQVFVWVHYFEPHEPYELHPGPSGRGPNAKSSDRDRYDGEVRFVDQEIERLVNYLERTRPGALLLIAADHGEEFSEHGGRYHGTTLYEEQIHVPLLLVELSAKPLLTPRTVTQPVGLIDVAPTLLGLLDIARSVRMRGHDLSPWLLSCAAELPHLPVYAEIGRQKAVVLDDNKLICDLATDTCQSYNLASDPAEQRNLVEKDPLTARRMRAALDSFLDEARRYEAPTAGPENAEQLILSRAQLGERGSLPQLLLILKREDASQERRQALALFAQLLLATPLGEAEEKNEKDPLRQGHEFVSAEAVAVLKRRFYETARRSTSDKLAAAEPLAAETDRRWAAVALLRLLGSENASDTDRDAVTQVVVALVEDDRAEVRQRLAGALSLGALPVCHPGAARPPIDCVGLWISVLPAAMRLEDPDAVRPLLALLGESRDKRARVPLEKQLETVRSRPHVVAALGALKDRAAVPVLAEVLANDPYVHVRAAAAKALGALGGAAAHAALLKAAAKEREAPVKSAIRAALSN